MKSLLLRLFIFILIVGCNINSKTTNIEEKEIKPNLVGSKIEKVYVKQNFNSTVEIEAFPKSKRDIFEQFGLPDKISEDKWEYFKVKGFSSIEYSFQSCCNEVKFLVVKNAETKLRSTMLITHIDCNKGLNDKFNIEKFNLQKPK